ncbi:MAG TPA: serine/threonine-protein kinase [Ktedonobacterales bacterium]|nr:serine/threonine-protein kinase [Ktedonobacterales bacterium]
MPEEFDFSTENTDPQQVSFLQAGTVVYDQYQIKRVLGSGGMGTVYLAIDTSFPDGRPCAIKETPTPIGDAPTPQQLAQMKGLRMEADIMSKLRHPSIPQVYNFFAWERHHYLVMEYIEGETLSDKLRHHLKATGTGFDEYVVLHWAIHLCELFSYLHHQNPPIIYRDCKPDNLIVTPNNELKLIDFGIARRLLSQEMKMTQIGTTGYAAPETYSGYGDVRTDIYSLGAMMHALITGNDPRTIELFSWGKHQPRQYRLAISIGMDSAIMRCLQDSPADRWQSARLLRDELISLLQHADARRRQTTGGGTPDAGSHFLPTHASSRFLPPTANSQILVTPSLSRDLYSMHALAPEIVWTFAAQGAIRSSPVVRDNVVYFGSHDAHLYAVALASGETIGSFSVGGFICSDPIVTEKSVIFGAEDGYIYAVDRALKRKQWSYHVGKAIVSTPAVIGDCVVIGADNGYVYAIPLSGEEPRWQFQTWGAIRGTLATLGSLIVFGSYDQRVYALDANGTRRWICSTRDKVGAAPILHNGMVIVGGFDRYVYAVEHETGVPVWRRAFDDSVGTALAAHENRLYVGSADGRINCLDARTGDTKWRSIVGSQITSDLILQGQRLYFGCASGAMYCFDVQIQQNVWRHQAGDAIVTRPAIAGDLVLIGSVDHYLYALRNAT